VWYHAGGESGLRWLCGLLVLLALLRPSAPQPASKLLYAGDLLAGALLPSEGALLVSMITCRRCVTQLASDHAHKKSAFTWQQGASQQVSCIQQLRSRLRRARPQEGQQDKQPAQPTQPTLTPSMVPHNSSSLSSSSVESGASSGGMELNSRTPSYLLLHKGSEPVQLATPEVVSRQSSALFGQSSSA
jgi:hypothetical protein